MKIDEALTLLESGQVKELFRKLYGDAAEENVARYQKLVRDFAGQFGGEDVRLFSSPGRTEISGNHTDHNHGKVLAGSINLDCVGASPTVPWGEVWIVWISL